MTDDDVVTEKIGEEITSVTIVDLDDNPLNGMTALASCPPGTDFSAALVAVGCTLTEQES
jgi:hypothetical protein